MEEMRRLPNVVAALFALTVLGCGSSPQGPGSEGTPPEVTTQAVHDPEVTLELEVEKNPEATELSLDMVQIMIRVGTKDPADVAVPGPPFLALKVRSAPDAEPLQARPHPLRGQPPSHFPVSLEAGESLELGPVDLGFFDLDPLELHPGEPYELTALYQANGGAMLRKVVQTVVLADSSLGFPLEAPLASAPPERAPVSLRVLDARGRPRRVFRWSPDLGFVRLAEEQGGE